MRIMWICFVLGLFGCPAPKQGSLEWTARNYTEALLQSNTEEMQKYAATGMLIQPADRNPESAALHVVRLCPQSASADGSKQRLLVLIGGSLNDKINGIDVVLIKEGPQWRVSSAMLSIDDRGVKSYLRNCQEDIQQMDNSR
jgi:hypothetical protein